MRSYLMIAHYWIGLLAGLTVQAGGGYRFFHGGGRVLTGKMSLAEVRAISPEVEVYGLFERN